MEGKDKPSATMRCHLNLEIPFMIFGGKKNKVFPSPFPGFPAWSLVPLSEGDVKMLSYLYSCCLREQYGTAPRVEVSCLLSPLPSEFGGLPKPTPHFSMFQFPQWIISTQGDCCRVPANSASYDVDPDLDKQKTNIKIMFLFQLINVSGTKSSYTNRNKELDANRNFAIYYDLENSTLSYTLIMQPPKTGIVYFSTHLFF